VREDILQREEARQNQEGDRRAVDIAKAEKP